MPRLPRAAWALVALSLLAPSIALATPTEVPPEHKKAYLAAVQLQNDGEYATALAAFEALPPDARAAATTKIHVAACKQRLGRWREAARDLEASAHDSSLDEATRDVARSDLQDLHDHAPKVEIKLSSKTKGVAVTIANEPVTPPATIELDPGSYTVLARRGGEVVYRHEVVAQPDKTVELVIAAPAGEPAAPVSTPTPTRTADRAPTIESSSSVLPWLAIGGGVAFGALAGFSYLSARSARDDLQASCDTVAGCDPDAKSRIGTWNTVTGVSLGAAVVGVGLGVYLLATRPARGPSASVALVPSADGVRLGLHARF